MCSCLLFQPSPHLGGCPLDLLQFVKDSLSLGSPRLEAVLQGEENKPCPQTPVYIFISTAHYVFGFPCCQGTLLIPVRMSTSTHRSSSAELLSSPFCISAGSCSVPDAWFCIFQCWTSWDSYWVTCPAWGGPSDWQLCFAAYLPFCISPSPPNLLLFINLLGMQFLPSSLLIIKYSPWYWLHRSATST